MFDTIMLEKFLLIQSYHNPFFAVSSLPSPSAFPIQNVKLRKAALKNSSFLDLLASTLERWRFSVTTQIDFRRLKINLCKIATHNYNNYT